MVKSENASINRIENGDISPVLANSMVEPKTDGMRAAIPAKIMMLVPFPSPRSVICSPSHIIKAVPAVNVIIVTSSNERLGVASPRDSRARAIIKP